MSTEPYVPSEEDVRVAYMDRQDFIAQIHDHDRKSDHTLSVEFGRFISKIKADARIAAWKEAAEFMRNQRSDDVTVLRAAHLAATTIYYRASQIEQEESDD
ncbi:hypothetical protein [Brevibacterium oceani]|uniref:hypothetical protein n=1 Tax=Brevibacterium oceani TaxID=358099 RepID=UPI0015E74678|nr:hypothetical protein [Brevibacterium oceani]